jgi:hypothetical protein
VSGASASGKTNLICSLLCDKRFYYIKDNPYFAGDLGLTFLFSGSAQTDDVWKNPEMHIKDTHKFSSLDLEALNKIWNMQEAIVKQKGIHKAPRILLIFDDIIDSKNIQKPAFQRIFFRGRHLNISSLVATQKYCKVPLASRTQMTNIMIFAPRSKEVKFIAEELAPAGMEEEDFKTLLHDATDEQYGFLHVALKEPKERMFRRNLDELLQLA